MAIVGAHMLLYTPEPEALRATLRDAFGLEFVEAHPGWLIFKLPPAELGVHPVSAEFGVQAGDETRHEICFMCDDLATTVADLRARGIDFDGEPQTESFGETITMVLPGGVRVLLYQPTHLSPLDLT
jgi:catechol 2,3-dioxygenase-like lactoylglutathione lyase family enzyme